MRLCFQMPRCSWSFCKHAVVRLLCWANSRNHQSALCFTRSNRDDDHALPSAFTKWLFRGFPHTSQDVAHLPSSPTSVPISPALLMISIGPFHAPAPPARPALSQCTARLLDCEDTNWSPSSRVWVCHVAGPVQVDWELLHAVRRRQAFDASRSSQVRTGNPKETPS